MRTLIVVLALSGCCWDPSPDPPAAPPPPPKPTALELQLAAMTPEDDAKQEELIQMAQKAKYLGPIEWRENTASVEVGSAFTTLPFKQKQSVALNVAILGMRKAGSTYFTIGLYDPMTGKSIGSYSTLYGGLRME